MQRPPRDILPLLRPRPTGPRRRGRLTRPHLLAAVWIVALAGVTAAGAAVLFSTGADATAAPTPMVTPDEPDAFPPHDVDPDGPRSPPDHHHQPDHHRDRYRDHDRDRYRDRHRDHGPHPTPSPPPTDEAPPDAAPPTDRAPAPSLDTWPRTVTYTVRWGDEIADLAARFRTTVDALLDRNPGISSDPLIVDDVLHVPFGYPSAPDAAPPLFLIRPDTIDRLWDRIIDVAVQPGDTLYRIARHYQTTPAVIAAVNTLNLDKPLKAGIQIRVPIGLIPAAR